MNADQYSAEAARRMSCRSFAVMEYFHHTGGFDIAVRTEVEAYRAAYAWRDSQTKVSGHSGFWIVKVKHAAGSLALSMHQESYRRNVESVEAAKPEPRNWHSPPPLRSHLLCS